MVIFMFPGCCQWSNKDEMTRPKERVINLQYIVSLSLGSGQAQLSSQIIGRLGL